MRLKMGIRIFLLLGLTGGSFSGFAQQGDKERPGEYMKLLSIDSVKAGKVSRIQAGYKAGLKGVMADTTLNEAAKRVRIDGLIGKKNRELQLMLSPVQQQKIIPSTERVQKSKPVNNPSN